MEMFLISVIVFAAGVMVINKFVIEPEGKEVVSIEERLKIKIDSLELKIARLEESEKAIRESLDHTQNLAENGEQFMKANEAEIKNLKKLNSTMQTGYMEAFTRLDRLENVTQKAPEIMRLQLEEFKKPIIAQIQQTRAQRPVQVVWKKHQAKDGKLHWVMTDKTVEYSRAEYLKKIKKQSKKK